jgi:hypothetical protein
MRRTGWARHGFSDASLDTRVRNDTLLSFMSSHRIQLTVSANKQKAGSSLHGGATLLT